MVLGSKERRILGVTDVRTKQLTYLCHHDPCQDFD